MAKSQLCITLYNLHQTVVKGVYSDVSAKCVWIELYKTFAETKFGRHRTHTATDFGLFV